MRNFYKAVSSLSKKDKIFFALCLLILSSLLLHAGFLENKFIDGEDLRRIVQNSLIRNISFTGLVHDIRGFIYYGYPPPFMTYVWGLIFSGWELNHIGFHFISFILHALNVALLFGLLVTKTKKILPALFGAFIFAMHPLHCETVNWISRQGLLLVVMFGLSFILLSAKKGRACTIFAPLFFVAALLFSPVSILFYPAERIINRGNSMQDKKNWGLLTLYAGVFVCAWGWKAAVFPFKNLVITAPSSVYYFISRVFFSWKIHFLLPSLNPPPLIPLTLAAGLILWTFFAWRRHHSRFWGLLFLSFLAIWLLHAGQGRFNGGLVYLSLMLFSYATGWAFSRLVIRRLPVKILTVFTAVALICSLGFLSYRRNITWGNTGSLVQDALEIDSRDSRLSALYSHYRAAMRDRKKAERLLKEIKDKNVDVLCLKAKAYALLFKTKEASRLFERVLTDTKGGPPDKSCIFDYATVKLQAGRMEETARLYREIIKQDPYFIYALHNLGTIMIRKKRYAAGLKFYSEVLKIAPSYRPTLENLAVYYMKKRDYRKAGAMIKNALDSASCPDEKRYYREWLKFSEKRENFAYAAYKWVDLVPPG